MVDLQKIFLIRITEKDNVLHAIAGPAVPFDTCPLPARRSFSEGGCPEQSFITRPYFIVKFNKPGIGAYGGKEKIIHF